MENSKILEENFEKVLNKYYLTFNQEKLNLEYQYNLFQLKYKLLRIIGCIYIVGCLLISVHNLIIQGNSIYSIITATVGVQQIIVQIFARRVPKLIDVNTILQGFWIIIYFIEFWYFDFLQEEQQSFVAYNHVILGITYSLFVFLWSFMLGNWIMRSIYFAIIFEYLILRIDLLLGLIQIVQHTFLFILLPITFYLMEKFTKRNFYQLFLKQKDLQDSQCLVVKAISSSIFISNLKVSGGGKQHLSCAFANQNCFKEFKICCPQDMLNLLDQFTMQNDSSNHSNFNLKNILYKKNSDLLKSFEHSSEDQYHYRCQIKLPHQSGLTYYYIKVVECVWEEKRSIMTILDNISEQVLNLHLLEIDRYKDNLLATVTHDLKTPLNCIISFSTSALHSVVMVEIKKCLQIIIKNALLQKFLISDILDFSQYKSNKLRINISECDISGIIDEVFEMFRDQAEAKFIKLEKLLINLDQQDTAPFQSDSNRIQQILINFVSNALKYTLQGRISIMAEKIHEFINSKPYKLLKLSIADTGVGIPDDVLQHLFKKYNTFNHNSASPNKNGIGLGLVICKKLVKKLGPYKQIIVDSQVGRGTVFTFYLFWSQPQNSSENYQQGSSQEQLLKPNHQFQSCSFQSSECLENKLNQNIVIKTSHYKLMSRQNIITSKMPVLIVDDNIYNVMALKAILGNFNTFKISTAENGAKALEKVSAKAKKKKSFKIIFTDLQMPIMDGNQLIKLIRQQEQQQRVLQKTFIVILTADEELNVTNINQRAFDSPKSEGQSEGADFILKKPVDLETMNIFLINNNFI